MADCFWDILLGVNIFGSHLRKKKKLEVLGIFEEFYFVNYYYQAQREKMEK